VLAIGRSFTTKSNSAQIEVLALGHFQQVKKKLFTAKLMTTKLRSTDVQLALN